MGRWAEGSFAKEEARIALFLRLTRKNLNALADFPIVGPFNQKFQKFSHSFARLEKDYQAGVSDPKIWAAVMLTLGATLTQSVKLI